MYKETKIFMCTALLYGSLVLPLLTTTMSGQQLFVLQCLIYLYSVYSIWSLSLCPLFCLRGTAWTS